MGGILQVDTIQNNNATTLITQTNSTTLTFGVSGQNIVIPSGVTFNTASATVTLPSTINATTINVTTVVLAAGAVGTPSLTTSGDTNTGIFFPSADTIAFTEGGAEAMRIDSSGNVGIGTTSPTTKLTVNGQLYATSSILAGIGQDTIQCTGAGVLVTISLGDFGGGGKSILQYDRSSGVFLVQSGGSGGVTLGSGGTAWASASDERQKTNLESIVDASNKLKTLRTVTGRFIADKEDISRVFLIAQDVKKVLPEAVDVQGDENGSLSLRYTDLIPLLIAGFKEQQAIIEELKARLAALENN